MPRYADETIQRIKQGVSLLRVAEGQGYQPVKQGKDYAVCCPFHEEKTPSCIISPKSNLFNCFGCGTGGSVIDWVMKTQGVSFRHAVELLKDDVSLLTSGSLPSAPSGSAKAVPPRSRRGGAASSSSRPVAKATVPKLAAPVSENAEDQTMLKQVLGYYHQTLLQAPEAQAYLAKRGLDNAELIKHFKLGYANRTLGLRLPERNRKAGKAIREQLQRIGLYRDTGREHFAGSLVIPVVDENGIVGEVYGRKLLDNLRKGTSKHTYLPGPHEGVFNPLGLHSEEVILCESLIDALTFWRWGFRHVTTSFGVNGFTDGILEALTKAKVKRVLIAYDRDASGDRAALEVAEKLNQNGIECFRILFPKGMDANSYATQTTPSQKALALVIRKAEWMGKGKAPERQLDIALDAPGFATPSSLAASLPSVADPQADENPINTDSNDPVPEKIESPQEQSVNEQASPVPAMPSSGVELQVSEHELFITLGDRVYRVRGLDSNSAFDQLKIQLLVKRVEVSDGHGRPNVAGAGCTGAIHMDKLDLYSSKQRQVFINQACVELGVKDEVIKKDLAKVLLTLEEHQSQQQQESAELKPSELTGCEREQALNLLRDKTLLSRILEDFDRAGVVGEHSNKLTGYLASVSRKLDKPLAVMIQSSSAAGKSSLMDSILAFMPEEERVQYSAMTGQSLFYMGETNLKNKILAISEEEGASNASYALKLLQSEGEVTIASTGKDDSTGNLVTKEYKVEGPVMLFMTTTAIDIDEELLNRCMVLSVNESREQTEAIHAAQRSKRTLQGLHDKLEKERIIQLHRNAQRLLKPLAVINPYADQLTFLSDKTRTRRDHEKYLTLIDSIALLHQYQRETKTLQHADSTLEYIEVTLEDIETANRLAHEILGRTLDELPPQTRKLLKEIQRMVRGECQRQGIEQGFFRFSRKSIRDFTGWSDGQLKIHCRRLEEMEYLLVHRGGRGQSMEYELLYSGDVDSDQAQVMGLLDTKTLGCTYDNQKSGQSQQKTASSQGQVRPKSDLGKSLNFTPAVTYRESGRVEAENALQVV